NAYTIMRRPIDIKRDQPIKLANAMLDMYHQITDIEFRGIAQSRFTATLAGLACQAVAQQVLFGNNDQVIGHKTVLQWQENEFHPAKRYLMFFANLSDTCQRALGITGHQDFTALPFGKIFLE